MRPNQLVTLTHFIIEAISQGNWTEAKILIRRRKSVIDELAESGQPISDQDRNQILASDQKLTEAFRSRRSNVLNRLRQIRGVQKVQKTYLKR